MAAVRADLPFDDACAECDRLRADEASARGERDHSRVVDCRVLARRHLQAAHSYPTNPSNSSGGAGSSRPTSVRSSA